MKPSFLIDTSTDPAFFLLSEGAVPLASKSIQGKNLLSRTILAEIKDFFIKNNCQIQAVQFIGIITGPGSFTSLRVGASVAKGLSYGLNIPLIGIPSLYSYLPKDFGSFICICPGRMKQYFLLKGTKSSERVVYSGIVEKMEEEKAFSSLAQVDHVITPFQEEEKNFSWQSMKRDPRHLSSMLQKQFQNKKNQSIQLIY